MQLEIYHDRKLVCLWLRGSESCSALPEAVGLEVGLWREMGYTVVIFHSGAQELLPGTCALLRHNRHLQASGAEHEEIAGGAG